MKAAIIQRAGEAPVFGDLPEPVVGEGEVRVRVTAAALSHVTRSRASGVHYSSHGQFPFVPGIDGVGRLGDRRRVYFFLPEAPNGSMAEVTAVPSGNCLVLPDDLDDITAAAIAIPGASSWGALTERAKLQMGETVLVNGATGASGRLAIQIARHLGAKRVIATGRNPETLKQLPTLGADVVIPLVEEDETLEESFKAEFAQGIDVVVDYLWGRSARIALIAGARAGEDGRAIRFVGVGSAGGPELSLPSAVLRSSAITLMGSGLGSIAPDRFKTALAALMDAVTPAELLIATKVVPISAIASAWTAADEGWRLVFSMGE